MCGGVVSRRKRERETERRERETKMVSASEPPCTAEVPATVVSPTNDDSGFGSGYIGSRRVNPGQSSQLGQTELTWFGSRSNGQQQAKWSTVWFGSARFGSRLIFWFWFTTRSSWSMAWSTAVNGLGSGQLWFRVKPGQLSQLSELTRSARFSTREDGIL
ncbi:hypothetical protein Hdeb2414_s0014g00425701 [Helianthus debilis subsp. tardiflorus]